MLPNVGGTGKLSLPTPPLKPVLYFGHSSLQIDWLSWVCTVKYNIGVLLWDILVCLNFRNLNYCMFTEHRDKLHGTVSTFEQVDEKIKGKLSCINARVCVTGLEVKFELGLTDRL